MHILLLIHQIIFIMNKIFYKRKMILLFRSRVGIAHTQTHFGLLCLSVVPSSIAIAIDSSANIDIDRVYDLKCDRTCRLDRSEMILLDRAWRLNMLIETEIEQTLNRRFDRFVHSIDRLCFF